MISLIVLMTMTSTEYRESWPEGREELGQLNGFLGNPGREDDQNAIFREGFHIDGCDRSNMAQDYGR